MRENAGMELLDDLKYISIHDHDGDRTQTGSSEPPEASSSSGDERVVDTSSEEGKGSSDDLDENSENNGSVDSRVSLAKNGLPKKRVQFMEDELLVRVQEIPAREETPLSQELAPCDPSKLTVDLEDVHLSNCLPKRAMHRPTMSIRRSQTRSASYSNRRKPPKKPLVVKPQTPPAKLSPAVRRLYGAALPKTTSHNSETCKKRLTPQGSGSGAKSPTVRQNSFTNQTPPPPNRAQAYLVPSTERAEWSERQNSTRIDLDMMMSLRSSSAISFGTGSGISGTSYTPNSTSSSSSSTSLPARLHHHHQSPYRQSSASSMSPNHFSSLRNLSSLRPTSSSGEQPSTGIINSLASSSHDGFVGVGGSSSGSGSGSGPGRQYPSTEYTRDRLLANGYRDTSVNGLARESSAPSGFFNRDSYPSSSSFNRDSTSSYPRDPSSTLTQRAEETSGDHGYRAFRAVPVSAKKVFAWNMANSQIPNIDTPSISPMWDTSPVNNTRNGYSLDTAGYS